jgi:hypothetical protein
MKTPAIIASLTVVGSLAYAAGSQGTADKPSSVMPSGTQAHSMHEEMPQVIPHAQILGGGCQTEPQEWFNPVPRRLQVCVGGTNGVPNQIGKLPLGAADVNADGVNEYFDTAYANSWDYDGSSEIGIFVASWTQPIGGTILYRSTTDIQPSHTVVWRNSVLEGTAAMGDQIRQMVGANLREIFVRAKGWRDIDIDGDLDLIAEVHYQVEGISGNFGLDIWFENIGYEVEQPPLAADINRDGQVDGADLCLVLASWEATP